MGTFCGTANFSGLVNLTHLSYLGRSQIYLSVRKCVGHIISNLTHKIPTTHLDARTSHSSNEVKNTKYKCQRGLRL